MGVRGSGLGAVLSVLRVSMRRNRHAPLSVGGRVHCLDAGWRMGVYKREEARKLWC